MTPEQYLEEQKKLKNEYVNTIKTYENAIDTLADEYAKSQQKYKKGDIIQQGETIICVKLFSREFQYPSIIPQPIYIGVELTKNLEYTNNWDASIHGNKGTTLLKEKE